MNAPSTAHLVQLLPLVFISLILPWYGQSRRGVLFGVTVPLGFANTPKARSALRSYRLSVSAFALTLLATAAAVLWLAPATSRVGTLMSPLAVFLELLVTFLLWNHGATTIKPFAAAVPLERHTELTPVSTTTPILATACSILPLAATALWLHLHWNQIPLRFVLHWNASGLPDRWATRSFDGVFGTLLTGVMMVVLLTAGAIFLSNANGPQRSQRRRALVPMAALAWLLAGSFCTLGLRPILHFTPSIFFLSGAMYAAGVFALTLWMLQRSGLAPYSKATESYDSTPDSKWHAGIIYYNPSDAAVLVPKRFGWGWTFNFARPSAWLYLGAILLVALSMKLFIP